MRSCRDHKRIMYFFLRKFLSTMNLRKKKGKKENPSKQWERYIGVHRSVCLSKIWCRIKEKGRKFSQYTDNPNKNQALNQNLSLTIYLHLINFQIFKKPRVTIAILQLFLGRRYFLSINLPFTLIKIHRFLVNPTKAFKVMNLIPSLHKLNQIKKNLKLLCRNNNNNSKHSCLLNFLLEILAKQFQ